MLTRWRSQSQESAIQSEIELETSDLKPISYYKIIFPPTFNKIGLNNRFVS